MLEYNEKQPKAMKIPKQSFSTDDHGMKMIYYYMLNKKSKITICEDIQYVLESRDLVIGIFLTPKKTPVK